MFNECRRLSNSSNDKHPSLFLSNEFKSNCSVIYIYFKFNYLVTLQSLVYFFSDGFDLEVYRFNLLEELLEDDDFGVFGVELPEHQLQLIGTYLSDEWLHHTIVGV